MPEEVRTFFMCGYFCEFLLLLPKFFFGNLLFTAKSGAEVQILQNDKKVDVCVYIDTENLFSFVIIRNVFYYISN